MRFGEAAALTWRDHDATRTSLGKPVIETSDRTKPCKETARRPGVTTSWTR
jgi:hypothetical protein